MARLPLSEIFQLAEPLPQGLAQLLKAPPLVSSEALLRLRDTLAREKRVVLLGPRGCGKSTLVAQALQTGGRGHLLLDPLEEHFKTLEQPLDGEASALGTLSSQSPADLERACGLLPGATLLGLNWPMRPAEWETLISQALLVVRDWEAANALRQHPDLARLKKASLQLAGLTVVPENSYPLHPWTAFLLPRLSALLDRPQQNAWTFFHGELPGSLGYFLNNSTSIQPSGELTLYTPDMLAAFFDPLPVPGYAQTLEAAARIPYGRRIVRLLALHRLLGHPLARCDAEFLAYALHLPLADIRQRGGDPPHAPPSIGGPPQVRPDVADLQPVVHAPTRYPLIPSSAVDAYRVLSQTPPPPRWKPVNRSDRFVRVDLIRGADVRPAFLKRKLEELSDPWNYHGDLYLAYVVPATAEEHQHILSVLSPRALPAGLVLAVPREPLLMSDFQQLLSYHLSLQSQYPGCDPLHPQNEELLRLYRQKQNYTMHALQQFYVAENLLFFADSKGARTVGGEELQPFLYDCFMRSLDAPPELGHPCLATLVDPPVRRRARRRAIHFLLRQGSEFMLLENGGQVHQILLDGLRQSGLLRCLKEGPGWQLCGPPDLEWPRGPFQESLRLLEQRTFQDPTGLPLPLLLDELVTGQMRLTPAMAEVVLACFLWMNKEVVAVYRDGRPLLDPAHLVQALHRCRPSPNQGSRSPLELPPAAAIGDYRLVRRRRSPAIDYFFRRLCQDLSGGLLSATPERARSLLLEWHARLSVQQVEIGRSRSPFNPAFLDWLERLKATDKDDLGVFLERFPWVFGMPPLGAEEAAVAPGRLLERLRAARGTIERSLEASRELLHLGLTEIFAEPFHQDLNAELQWPTLIYRWFAQLPGAARESMGSEPIHSLLSAFSPEAQDREENLDDLLSELGYPRTDQWPLDYATEILERIRLAKTQMELGDLLGIYPVPPSQRAEAAKKLLRNVLLRSELSPQDLIEVIERELTHLDTH